MKSCSFCYKVSDYSTFVTIFLVMIDDEVKFIPLCIFKIVQF